MAASSSLLARLSAVLGRRRSRPTPPADFRFKLGDALERAAVTTGGKPFCPNFVSVEPEDDGLPRADAGIDEPRHAEPFVDSDLAAIDRH
jgi:hypothetical protein